MSVLMWTLDTFHNRDTLTVMNFTPKHSLRLLCSRLSFFHSHSQLHFFTLSFSLLSVVPLLTTWKQKCRQGDLTICVCVCGGKPLLVTYGAACVLIYLTLRLEAQQLPPVTHTFCLPPCETCLGLCVWVVERESGCVWVMECVCLYLWELEKKMPQCHWLWFL